MDILSYIGGVADILIILATFFMGSFSSFNSTIETINQMLFFIGNECDKDFEKSKMTTSELN